MTVSISHRVEENSKRIEFISYFNNWLLKLLFGPLSWAKRKLNQLFDELYIVSSAGLNMVNEYSPYQAEQELITLRKLLPPLRKMVARFEEVQFFGDEIFEEKVQKTLDLLYELEGELKMKAYTGHDKNPTNKELVNTLAGKSKSAMANTLAKS